QRAEELRRLSQRSPEAPEQVRAAAHSGQGIGRGDLERSREAILVERLERRRLRAPGRRGIGGEKAALEHAKARHGEALRASVLAARLGLEVAPARSRAGVEEHAGDREVDARSRTLVRRESG